MRTIIGLFLFSTLVSYLSACHDEFHSLTDTQSGSCQDTTLQNNIVGTWHFASSYELTFLANAQPMQEGTVTFTADKAIIDPDSLFRVHHTPITVEQETYEPSIRLLTPGGDFGQVFAVRLYGQKITQVDAFTVLSHTCHQIELAPAHTTKASIVLTRL